MTDDELHNWAQRKFRFRRAMAEISDLCARYFDWPEVLETIAVGLMPSLLQAFRDGQLEFLHYNNFRVQLGLEPCPLSMLRGIFKELYVGGTNVEGYIEKLQENKIILLPSILMPFGLPGVKNELDMSALMKLFEPTDIAPRPEKVRFVRISNYQLRLGGLGVNFEKFTRPEAHKLGLMDCTHEDVLALRLAYLDQPDGERLYLGMEPVVTREHPHMWILSNQGGKLSLQLENQHGEPRFEPEHEFVWREHIETPLPVQTPAEN
jgi:hypothetical protein